MEDLPFNVVENDISQRREKRTKASASSRVLLLLLLLRPRTYYVSDSPTIVTASYRYTQLLWLSFSNSMTISTQVLLTTN